MAQLQKLLGFGSRWQMQLVCLSILMIFAHLLLKILPFPSLGSIPLENYPLIFVITVGGLPLLAQILLKVKRGDFGADVLAAIALITAALLDQYLAATLIILMLASGQALETYALGKASSVLKALADRMPSTAHLKEGETIREINLNDIKIGDQIAVFPHEVSPVDGVVYEGQGKMDESYLTGEPYQLAKAPGTTILSGAINGETMLIVQAEKLPVDSRYNKIVEVMTESQQKRPTLRRLGDQVGAVFVPIALGFAGLAWVLSGDPMRFLSVLVIATPCPLLIAIPITIISAISMAARQGIIIKDPVALERLPTCRTAIFDKTGTLTYGKPELINAFIAPGFEEMRVLQLASSLEKYSKHPLAQGFIKATRKHKLLLREATKVSERPGQGLTGVIEGQKIHITHRKRLLEVSPNIAAHLPSINPGLECIVMINNAYAGTFQFRDAPRKEGLSFIRHLGPKHKINRILLVSGDKESEVRYLADLLKIREVHFSQSPEQKLDIMRHEIALAPTLFVGDGINDAPALTLATVGIAFGSENNITAAAAGVVVLDNNLRKVDQFIHISYTMRKIALQSAVGGMVLSLIGMGFAAFGYITPVAGALLQEGIDILAIFNALRLTFGQKIKTDMKG
ncbi:MAG: cadmium-translocating P-type ATPase [Alphaproteobacteria bacterium]|jgi:heavy metal translocating P-type ATPase|nr:cadmium-translocating P-type ATPase [Alphaproteobacteria bacterium]